MAKNKRNRVYKLTPRRKAALAKAQKASARKRRRRGTAIAGVVGATIVAGGAVYAYKKYGNKKINVVTHTTKSSAPQIATPIITPSSNSVMSTISPQLKTPEIALSTSKELDLVRVNPARSGKNWKIVGRPIIRTTVEKKVKHIEHDRLWNKKRKDRARQDRKNLLKRRYYRLKQQAAGKWKVR